MGFQEILKPISKEIRLVSSRLDRQVKKICDDQSLDAKCRKEIRATVQHLFNSPGKLLRPALVLLASKTVDEGSSSDSLIDMAVAVEFIHSASLVHDDIIDESELRRDQPSLNNRYGNHLAVLVGDILYSQFFTIVTNLESEPPERRIKLLEVFSGATKRMCIGEIYEQRIRNNGVKPTLEDYLFIIESKTASLLSTCCFAGALLNHADENHIRQITEWGLFLGLAFQIVDDYLDEDSIFDNKPALLEKAGEFLSLAEARMEPLSPTAAGMCLNQIGRYVIGRIK
jgi:octaprenyl-diphosphate synthase